MTEKANPSINRPAEAFKTAGAIAYGGADEGFVVEANSPTPISVQDSGIIEGNLNAFDETSSASSLDVNIDGGEAFVFGAWVAIDTQTTVTLAASTNGQTVSVGWNKNGTDDVIVGLDSAFSSASGDADQKIPLWEFDTDGSGVTSVTDLRSFDQISADSIEQGAGSGLDADTVDGVEADELGGGDIANDGSVVTSSTDEIDFTTNITATDDGDGTTTVAVDDAFVLNAGDTMSGDLDMDSNNIVDLGAPAQDSDAATKAYVDATAEGLDVKDAVRVCTCDQGNIDLSSSADPNPVDTVTLNDGDRILLIEQDDATENGIYDAVTADDPTTWVRSADANEDDEVNSGLFTLAVEGSTSGNVGFILITPDPITLGTTALNFTRFSGAEAIEAGDNLSRTGSRLDVVGGSGSGLDADKLDGEEVTFTSPEDEEIVIFDAQAGEWKNADAGDTLIQKFDQDVTVTVGAGGDFTTLNDALEHLTDRYPQYTQAEGQSGGFTAVVRMLDDFVMEEQVLVDGIHLDWIRLETTRGSGVQEITDIDAGDTISGFAQAEETTITFEDINPDDFYVDNTNSDLDGEYVALGTADSADAETYYFWFNVTDLTDLPTFSSNAGDPSPTLQGSPVTGVQVDIALEDSPTDVATALQTEIDTQNDLAATISGREITVTDQDGGIVAQSATSTSAKITTSVDTNGTTPDIPTQSEQIIDVTTDASNYLFDFSDGEGNQNNPSLNVVRGETYELDLSVSGDPFRIQTDDAPYDSNDEYTDGISSPGAETGSWTWTVANDAPDTLYYVSENDASKEGFINVVDEAPVAEVTSVDVDDYTVEAFRTTYLEDEHVTLQNAAGSDFYYWFNVGGNSSDPSLAGTGSEVTLAIDEDETDAASELQTAIDATTDISATVSGAVVTATNDNTGEADDATTNSNNIAVQIPVQGRGSANHAEITTASAHGFSGGDRITIRDHDSGVEEFNYNGQFVVRDTNVTTNTFELQFSDNPAARFDATRANIASGTTPEVVSPEPVPVSAESLTEQWEFFYQPAFGVARGSLPTINCTFDMDDSDGQSYQSYYDGLCATDRGHINITPFNGFINAAGSNIYATRSSIINANDAIADGAGRMGVWAYSNSIINARRVSANGCGLVGASADQGDGFDSEGRPIGNCINATRGSLVNAEGATVGGAQSDNVYASYGGMINLDGHFDTVTFGDPSVNGQDIGIDGGIVTRQNKIVTDTVDVQDGYEVNGSPLDSDDVGAVDDSQFPTIQLDGVTVDSTDTINFET